jgi:hypothetical protein
MKMGNNKSFESSVIGYYSISDDLELKGSPQDWDKLGRVLLLAKHNKAVEVILFVPNQTKPTPYDGFLTSMVVIPEKIKSQLEIKRENSKLLIVGPSETIEILAVNMLGLADVEPKPSYHMHIEYFPEHYYLAPSSHPLVITCISPTNE